MAFNPFGAGMTETYGPGSRIAIGIGLKRPQGLLTQCELKAFEIISQCSPPHKYLIFPQVQLLQTFKYDELVLNPKFTTQSVFAMYRKAIAARIKYLWNVKMAWRSVDFLLCEVGTTKVAIGIEIDDPSHALPERLDSDQMKDVLFASAGIPLLRFTNNQIDSLYLVPVPLRPVQYQVMYDNAMIAWNARVLRLAQ